ncbi:MAG: T9SS type A sorting domain-containing protein, partial [Bacteroidales bacterium]
SGTSYKYTDTWLMKLNENGDILWNKPYGGNQTDYNYAFEIDGDKVIIPFSSYSDDGDMPYNKDPNLNTMDIWVGKLDKWGTPEWEKIYGGTLSELAFSITKTQDKGYILAGYSQSINGDITVNKGEKDFLMLKLDSLGNLAWQATYGGTQDDIAYLIIETNDGGYLLVGETYSNNGDVKHNYGMNDVFVVRTCGKTFTQKHIEICSGDSVLLQGKYRNTNGIYYDTLYNKYGCDSIIVTKLSINPSFNIEKNIVICTGDSLLFDKTYLKNAGTYSKTFKSVSGCDSIVTFHITLEKLPVVMLGIDTTICSNTSVNLSAYQKNGYYSYMWSTGSTNPIIEVTQSGIYKVTVKSEKDCKTTAQKQIYVQQSPVTQLCVATVSPQDDYVIVAWERIKNQGIKSYQVYREDYGGNTLLATIPFDSLSVFIDKTANFKKQSYKYAIKTVDTCGTISHYGTFHQTIHLSIIEDLLTGGLGLIWTPYQGRDFDGYKVIEIRPDNTIKEFDKLSVSNTKYTVVSPTPGAKYRVIVDFPVCSPELLKADSGPFSQSISNLSESSLTSLQNSTIRAISVFPIPVKNELNVEIDFTKKENCTMRLINTSGTIVYQKNFRKTDVIKTQIQTSKLLQGVYILEIKTDAGIWNKTVVVQ